MSVTSRIPPKPADTVASNQSEEKKISVEEFRQNLLERGADPDTVEQMISMYDDGEAGAIEKGVRDGFITEGELLYHADDNDYLSLGLADDKIAGLLQRKAISVFVEHDYPVEQYDSYEAYLADYNDWRLALASFETGIELLMDTFGWM